MGVTVSGGGASGGTPAVVLSTTNAAGTASTFLRTNDQIAVFDATVPVTQASADAAATGAAAVAARRDHRHGMPTISTGAVTRAGGNLTEATSTSATTVDLLTVTGLSIAAGIPFIEYAVQRKTIGAAARMIVGNKINATEIRVPAPGGIGIATNEAASGSLVWESIANVATYLRAGSFRGLASGAVDTAGTNLSTSATADAPAATITDLIFEASMSSTLITGGMDEGNVYTYVNA